MHGSRQIVRTPSCRGLRPAKATNVGMLRSQHPNGWNRWMLQGTYSPRRLLKIRRPGLRGCDCRTPGMQRLQRSVSVTDAALRFWKKERSETCCEAVRHITFVRAAYQTRWPRCCAAQARTRGVENEGSSACAAVVPSNASRGKMCTKASNHIARGPFGYEYASSRLRLS